MVHPNFFILASLSDANYKMDRLIRNGKDPNQSTTTDQELGTGKRKRVATSKALPGGKKL